MRKKRLKVYSSKKIVLSEQENKIMSKESRSKLRNMREI